VTPALALCCHRGGATVHVPRGHGFCGARQQRYTYSRRIAAPELEWSFDMEDIPSEEDGPHCNHEFLMFLRFHPYKEVVFLHQSCHRGIAYHLNSSKIQDLGSIDYRCSTGCIYKSFPYTPCWTGNL
jgi:hypothetical protein